MTNSDGDSAGFPELPALDSPPLTEAERKDWCSVWQAESLADLESLRVELLGKKGTVTQKLRSLSELSPDERRKQGSRLNQWRSVLEEAIKDQKRQIEQRHLLEKMRNERIDTSLPGRQTRQGHRHPIHQVIEEIAAIFLSMGFVLVEGNDIEDEHHNFAALNFPDNHPARDMHDSFYLASDTHTETESEAGSRYLLRTHTSPMQVRSMLQQKPPLRLIIPGRTFRRDLDITHTPMFHQVEGLVVDTTSHLGHLKGCLTDFCRAFFEVENPPMRFRGSFFPFTEPSLEVDIRCEHRSDTITIGQGDQWVEVLGCGMVHPNVLRNVGLDPREYQGFAFGMGVERLAMLKYGIPDLRSFFQSDLRWLRHFGFTPRLAASLEYGLTPF